MERSKISFLVLQFFAPAPAVGRYLLTLGLSGAQLVLVMGPGLILGFYYAHVWRLSRVSVSPSPSSLFVPISSTAPTSLRVFLGIDKG